MGRDVGVLESVPQAQATLTTDYRELPKACKLPIEALR